MATQCLAACLSVCLSLRLSVGLFPSVFVCLSICLSGSCPRPRVVQRGGAVRLPGPGRAGCVVGRAPAMACSNNTRAWWALTCTVGPPRSRREVGVSILKGLPLVKHIIFVCVSLFVSPGLPPSVSQSLHLSMHPGDVLQEPARGHLSVGGPDEHHLLIRCGALVPRAEAHGHLVRDQDPHVRGRRAVLAVPRGRGAAAAPRLRVHGGEGHGGTPFLTAWAWAPSVWQLLTRPIGPHVFLRCQQMPMPMCREVVSSAIVWWCGAVRRGVMLLCHGLHKARLSRCMRFWKEASLLCVASQQCPDLRAPQPLS